MRILHGRDQCLYLINAKAVKSPLTIRPDDLVVAAIVLFIKDGPQKTDNDSIFFAFEFQPPLDEWRFHSIPAG